MPVDLTADSLKHDDATGVITASGNVELVQGERVLRADMVSYNLNTGTASARGNVSVTEPNGDVHFADEVQLNNEMQTGFIRGLQTYMAEGGHFTIGIITNAQKALAAAGICTDNRHADMFVVEPFIEHMRQVLFGFFFGGAATFSGGGCAVQFGVGGLTMLRI